MKRLGFILLCTALLLCGCSSENDNVDSQALAQDIFDATTWVDQVEEMDSSAISTLYGTHEGVTARLWMGSGATAEELAVFSCDSKDTAAAVYKACEERVAEQLDAFRDYVPGEVTKLEAPLLVKKGKSVYLLLADDTSKASDIIERAY